MSRKISYLVIGNKGDDHGAMKGFLRKHGKKFGQDCVLYKAWDSDDVLLIGTKKDAWPGDGNIEAVGRWHPNRMGQFFSMLKNGRTFTFASIRFLKLRSFFSRVETDF